MQKAYFPQCMNFQMLYESGRIGFFMLRALHIAETFIGKWMPMWNSAHYIRRISLNSYLYERIPLEYEMFFQFSHISFSSERDDTFLALKISMSSQQGAPYNMTFACVRIYTSGILSILILTYATNNIEVGGTSWWFSHEDGIVKDAKDPSKGQKVCL